jgi:hypothetical protein
VAVTNQTGIPEIPVLNVIKQEAEAGIETNEAIAETEERPYSRHPSPLAHEGSKRVDKELESITQPPSHDRPPAENVNGETVAEIAVQEAAEPNSHEDAVHVAAKEHELPGQKPARRKRSKPPADKAKDSQESDKHQDRVTRQRSSRERVTKESYTNALPVTTQEPKSPAQKPARRKRGKPPAGRTEDNQRIDRDGRAASQAPALTHPVENSIRPQQGEDNVSPVSDDTAQGLMGQPDAKLGEPEPGSQGSPQAREIGLHSRQAPPKNPKKRRALHDAHGQIDRPRATVPDVPELSPQEERSRSVPPEQPVQSKPRRKKPSGSKNSAQRAKKRREKSPEGEAEDTQAGAKSKTSRETVQITVHRLANTAALDGLADASSASSNEADSGDELTTTKKLPNRGGVNPADVFSQVCRETLEKTLASIKSDITNESNPSQRAVLIRKRNAVEAFGSELEGRLFELSEVLDSNFILAWKLKRAKREMGELRNRLLQLRQQRNEIALRMDGVRRKHTDEESAKMVGLSYLSFVPEPVATESDPSCSTYPHIRSTMRVRANNCCSVRPATQSMARSTTSSLLSIAIRATVLTKRTVEVQHQPPNRYRSRASNSYYVRLQRMLAPLLLVRKAVY